MILMSYLHFQFLHLPKLMAQFLQQVGSQITHFHYLVFPEVTPTQTMETQTFIPYFQTANLTQGSCQQHYKPICFEIRLLQLPNSFFAINFHPLMVMDSQAQNSL